LGQGDEIIQNNDLKLQKEDRLLLLCSTTKVDDLTSKKIESLINPELDWDHLVEMANRHRLLPLLYVNLNSICPEKVPEEVLENLKEEFHENARKNLLLTGELVKVMKLLENNGINAVTYKGPVLAHSVYGNLAYRQFGDIDILTDKKGALKAKNLMISNGYELYQPIKIDDQIFMELESEYIFKNKNNGAKVEINWNFEGKFFYFADNPNFLFEDLKEFDINSFRLHSFSSVNQILMLSIHAAKHNWARLYWISDISHFIQSQDIDWVNTLKKAEKLGIKRILMINLFLARDFFGLELPEEILNYQDSSINSILINIKKRIFREKKNSLNIFEKFFLDIKKREKLSNGIKDCLIGFTRPSYNDFKDLSLPKKLFPLYPFIRPMLLVKRYGRNSI